VLGRAFWLREILWQQYRSSEERKDLRPGGSFFEKTLDEGMDES
jgi:hypothetical protein